MGKRFSGKTVFITGASSGIGAALALEFACEGARVSLAARRSDWLAKIEEKIAVQGGQALSVICDVTKPDTVKQAISTTIDKFATLDIVIANAGFAIAGTFEDLHTDDFRRQFATNFFGLVDTIYASLPHLIESKGKLVLMGSVLGRVGLPTTSAYTASKFAVNGLAQTLDYELAGHGIRVICINPGLVESNIARVDNQGVFKERRKDLRPKKFTMPASKAARQMVTAIYRNKPETTITGHGKMLVHGFRCFPRMARWTMRAFAKKRIKMIQKKRRQQ